MKRLIPLFLTLFLTLTLAACGSMGASSEQYAMEPASNRDGGMVAYDEEMGDSSAPMEAPMAEIALAQEAGAPMPAATMSAPNAGATSNNQVAPSQRLIIKTAELELTVDDTAVAMQNTTDTVVGAGGYIVSQRVWEVDGFRYGSMQLGVPVAEFERVLTMIRRLGDVTVDIASGQDITDEFVDLNSRLGNLQATQTRLREFLNDAQNVEEILAVNAELSRVEEQLEVIQGRINYLADRAAFSTITLSFNPIVPTPTPWPTSTPPAWNPLGVAGDASEDLVDTAQDTIDSAIYATIFCGPWVLVALVMLFGVYRLVRFVHGRVKKNVKKKEGEGTSEEGGSAA